MKLVIETFWNKVVPDKDAPFGTKVLPEFELKDSLTYRESGWESVEAWKKDAKQRHGFQGFDAQGRAKFELSKSYGIRSYQLVSVVS